MLKLSARILALAALGFAVAAPRPSHAAAADDHVGPPNWSHAYVLTPLEHKRLRGCMEAFLARQHSAFAGTKVRLCQHVERLVSPRPSSRMQA